MKKKVLIIVLTIIFIIQTNIIYGTTQQTNDLDLYSEAAILIDYKTRITLYSKNAEKIMFPASTTKIMTAILAIENCNLEEIITIPRSFDSYIPQGYSNASLQEGEEITIKNLISVFLVHSANESGYILAEYISGSVEQFSNLMNKKASEIGCKNTHFTNPSGIHNNDHYSTAYDLSLIAKYCMKNKTFREIVSTKTCNIPATNKSGSRTYTNTNDLIIPSSSFYLKDCIGIKTGFTSEAGNCLISCCSKNNLEFICVVLGGQSTSNIENSRFLDSINLYKFGYSTYSYETILTKNSIINTIEVPNGSKETRFIDLILENDITVLKNINEETKQGTIFLNSPLSAPISQNDILGTITYEINGISYSSNLLASHDVDEDIHMLIVFKIILIILIFWIVSIILFSNSKKKKEKKSKYSDDY